MTLNISLGDIIMIAIQIASFSHMFGVHKTKIENLEDVTRTNSDEIRDINKHLRRVK